MIPSSFWFLINLAGDETIDLAGDEIIDFTFSSSLASLASATTDPFLSNRPTLISFLEF